MSSGDEAGIGRSLGRSLSASMGRGFNVLLSVVSTVVLARALAPEARGQFAIAGSVTGIGVQCVTFGLPASILYFSAIDPKALRRLHQRAQAVVLLASAAFAAVVVALRLVAAPEWCSELDGVMIALSCVNVAVCGSLMIAQAACLASGDTARYGWSDAATRLMAIVALLTVASIGRLSPTWALLVTVLAGIATTIWLVRSHVSDQSGDQSKGPPLSAELRYGLKSAAAGALGAIPVRTMMLAVASREGDAASGQFAVALSVAETLVAMGGAFAATRLASMVAARDRPGEARRVLVSTLVPVTSGAVVCAMAMASFAQPMFRIAFGERYLAAASVLVDCAPGAASLAVATVFQHALAARGLPSIALLAPAVSAFVTFVLLALVYQGRSVSIGMVFSSQGIVFLICAAAALTIHSRQQCNATFRDYSGTGRQDRDAR